MKTTMKTAFIGLGLAIASVSQAQQSMEYSGGPHSNVTPEQLRSLQGWVKNTRSEIDRLLNNVAPILDSSDKKHRLFTRMETLVQNSEPRASDLLLRHAIYAGLTVNKLIDRQTVSRGREFTPEGTVDQQVRVLRRSLEIAREYYQSDLQYVNGIPTRRQNFANPKRVEFGVKFSSFLIKMSDGVLNAPANYGMIRWSLGILNNYMIQDDRNTAYASTIKYLANELSNYPDIVNGAAAPDDAKCVQYVRELKRLGQEVYTEIANATRDLQAPQANMPDLSAPLAANGVQAPVQDLVQTGTASDSYAQYPWTNRNGQRTFAVSIPNSPVNNAGQFQTQPVSTRVGREVYVLGLGMDNHLYYVSTSSASPRRVERVNNVSRIEGAAVLNGLAAVVYRDEFNNRITLNIAGQNRVE